jgi:prophage tail gpP-like protein
MPVYTPSAPETEQIQLRLMDEHVTLKQWTSYDFASDYLTPAAGFHFTIGSADISTTDVKALKVGGRVKLTVNDVALSDGHIDTIEVSASRSSGMVWSSAGRERLGIAVDAIADPTRQFKEGVTLATFLKELYTPFGWFGDEHFSIDNSASRAVTRGLRGTPTSKGRKKFGKPLQKFVLHQL